MFYTSKYCSNQFIKFRGPLHIFKIIKSGNVLLRKAEKKNKDNRKSKENPKHRSKDQLEANKKCNKSI